MKWTKATVDIAHRNTEYIWVDYVFYHLSLGQLGIIYHLRRLSWSPPVIIYRRGL